MRLHIAWLAVITVMATRAWAVELPAQAYTGCYTGKIIPTPKEVAVDLDTWEVADCATKRVAASVLISAQATEAERLAAQEIALRIQFLSGGLEVPVLPDTTPPAKAGVVFGVGIYATSKFLQRHLRACGTTTPDSPEGYAIACYEHEAGFRGVLLAGKDAAGTYFAAQSLVQLMERKADKVLLHPVKLKDWPTFALRSFKLGGAFDPNSAVLAMGTWAPRAKFNCYNICYTTLGRDKWKAPDPGYVEHVRALTGYLRSRGLDCMPFVNPYYLWQAHIETSREADLVRLFEACRIGPAAGGRRVMLCLDDFASEPDPGGPALYHVRSAADQARWGDDLAAVNAAMVNDLWGRLKAAHPDSALYVVLPYYWNPSGHYREGGEKYLRDLARAVDPAVRIVWTGPQVRSAVIAPADVARYQSLVGDRRVMLWDNTLYMHHTPPHYFLDTFHTRYPERFWELTSSEVHLNAGGGEAYKCGLLAAADYLWNPEAYDPERSLRNAIAAVAGPDQVDDLLAFRDAFYALYDDYTAAWGTPAKLLAQVKTLTHRMLDDAEMRELGDLLAREATLAGKIAAGCTNPELVAEVRSHADMHAPYREVLALLAKLPPPPEEDGDNLALNPGAEELAGTSPAHWGLYTGAGRATLTCGEGRGEGHCAKLTATELHDWPDGRKSINVAVLAGDTNGFDGARATPVLPLQRYYFSFWVRGTAPRVVVSFVTWDAAGSRGARGKARVQLAPFAAPAEWTFVSGSCLTGPAAARGALKIGLDGYLAEGGGLGEVCVDDVYVGRSRARAAAGAGRQ